MRLTKAHNWHICVIVPARDEEQLLPCCLSSLIRAKNALPVTLTCDITVAIDSSTDDSFRLCKEILRGHGTGITVNEGAVGAVRAAAVEFALASYSGSLKKCWIANTDADCVVPEDWLTRQWLHAASGVQAVAGTIDVNDFREHKSHVEERFRATYLRGHDGKHPHVHGANLGVRADMYRKAGGWPSLETAEDHTLWRQLRIINAKVISDTCLVVETSGRRVGRAPHGAALAAHNTQQ